MGIKTGITFHTEGTPNSLKPTILLAELGLEYKPNTSRMNRGSSKINPNGHIPALDDEDEAGNKVTLFESTSMLLYLVGKYDKDHKVSYPYGSPEYWKTVNWHRLTLMCLGMAPQKHEYSVGRYVNETRRLYRVLDTQLASKSGYIVGNRVTVADIAIWNWVAAYKYSGLSKLLKRPGFEEGRNAPRPHVYLELKKLSDGELDARDLASGEWIQEGMRRDAEA
ncbi:hypothetical protein BDW67DRAFT_178109 [Aspergillus spinulosporus]